VSPLNTQGLSALAHVQSVIFDFDGTLAPNLDLADMRAQVVALTQRYQVPDAVFNDRMIVEVVSAARSWLQQHQPNQAENYFTAAHQLIEQIELAAATTNVPFTATESLLRQLRNAGCASAIVTRNCRAAVETTFADVHQQVDVLLARDDVAHVKPDTRHLQQALTLTRTPAHRAVMVGDGKLDMQMGKALGLTCVGVLGGSNDEPALTQAGADVVLPSIATLLLST